MIGLTELGILCICSALIVCGFVWYETKSISKVASALYPFVGGLIALSLLFALLKQAGYFTFSFEAIISYLLYQIVYLIIAGSEEKHRNINVYGMLTAGIVLGIAIAVSFNGTAIIVAASGIGIAALASSISLLINIKK